MWQEAAKEEAAAGTAAAQELESARQQVRGAGSSGGSEWDPDWHSKGFRHCSGICCSGQFVVHSCRSHHLAITSLQLY